MKVCYWALLFMPLVILHHLLNVFVQLANKRGSTKKKIIANWLSPGGSGTTLRQKYTSYKLTHYFQTKPRKGTKTIK
jgi:hypothetical protein